MSRYREALEEIRDLIVQMPGGIDKDADPQNLSPETADSHLGGLIWQICNAALGKKADE